MKKYLSLCLALVAVLLFSSCEKETDFRIKRGTNLSHWLSQSEERGEARRLHIQEDDFERLEQLGFDFVRIPIDEEQFWDEDGNKLPEAWDLLKFALGVDVRQRGAMGMQTDISIRGGTYNQVAVLLDGINTSCPTPSKAIATTWWLTSS